MGLFSSSTRTRLLMPSWQKDLSKSLTENVKPLALERMESLGTPYGGDLTAPLSKYEQTGLGNLESWLNMPSPTEDKLYGLGREEYEKTLGGDYYDPEQSQYWTAYNSALDRKLQEARDRLHATTSSRDQYFSSGRVAGEGELEEQAMLDRALVLADLMERERERRLGTVPAAMDFLRQGEGFQEGRVAAAEQYGALPRIIEQMGLDKEYAEFIRQMQELNIPIDVALTLATKQYPYSVQQTGGGLGNLLSTGLMAAGMAGGFGPMFGGIGNALGGIDLAMSGF